MAKTEAKKTVKKSGAKPASKAAPKPAKAKVEKKKPVAKVTSKATKASTPTKKVAVSKPVKTKPAAKAKAPAKTSSKKKSNAKSLEHVEVISPSKKVKKIQGYSKKDLEEFKKVIFDKRNEIIEQLQILKDQMMDPTTGQYVNENSPYSLHMAEQGTDAMEREKLYLWAQRENKFLGYLDDALQRIDNGTYGICIECIDEPQHLCATCPLIPKERLMAVPHTQHCLQVKQKMKK
ncbi:MAG: conjugal transfer protein TraR [Ignavibacteriaceae bacterium]|mgnify:FL=1|jgi:RNA polymerase-binding transcription factor DksA|nr:conjugal transfer protein TraR [Ignavibacteriaceae bacterium]